MHKARLIAIPAAATALLLLTLARVAAQAPEAEAAGEPRRYTVEVIVFRYAEEVSVGSEVFLPEPPPEAPADDYADGAFVFSDRREPGQVAAADDAGHSGGAGTAGEFDFVLLLPDEYSLNDTYRRLERLDVYDPLLHVAWTQTTLPEEQTQVIELPALAEPPDGLEGFFKLYLSRYLHLVVDLTLDGTPAMPVEIDDSAFSYQERRRSAAYGSDEPLGRLRYRIAEDRIFKSGDLRYFDHPKFGVLAKVTRVEEQADGEVVEEMLGYDPADLPGNNGQ